MYLFALKPTLTWKKSSGSSNLDNDRKCLGAPPPNTKTACLKVSPAINYTMAKIQPTKGVLEAKLKQKARDQELKAHNPWKHQRCHQTWGSWNVLQENCKQTNKKVIIFSVFKRIRKWIIFECILFLESSERKLIKSHKVKHNFWLSDFTSEDLS